MTDIPRRALTRTVKLAGLPLGVAGRAAMGAGRRLAGTPAEVVTAQLQARTAEQIFAVLGELKGGAMKVGQALSIFEAAMPPEAASPYRATLTKLQEAAPAMPVETVYAVLAENLGPRWRQKFEVFEDEAVASASVGQVHRAVWRDGRQVAVKLQYPGAGEALVGDIRRLTRVMKVATGWLPGLDVSIILDELLARVSEELDYAAEARHQRAFARAFADDPHVRIPDVVHVKGNVIVSEWMPGRPLADVIAHGSSDERDHAGERYMEFLLRGPQEARRLHADPHPGNFRIDGDRLVVLDFGAVDALPKGLPRAMGHILSAALRGDAEAMHRGLDDEGFIRGRVDATDVLAFLEPFVEPLHSETFHFTRAWFRSHAVRLQDPRRDDFGLGLNLTLPPEYLLIHRVWAGGLGVLSQLDATVPARSLVATWIPDVVL